jgi:hypothetical protein
VLICERFDFRKTSTGQQGANLYPAELIGVVNLHAQQVLYEDTDFELVMQMPSYAGAGGKTGHFTDKKLKELNLYNVGLVHSRDAVRHLLMWYEFGSGFKYNKKGYGPWIS